MFELMNTVIAMTPTNQGSGGGASQMLPTLLMFGAIILVMYFLMIRPQQKRQKEHQKMLQSIQKGDKIITTAGIHGTVTDVEEKTIELQIADNVRIKFEKTAIAGKK